jgi:hypothetical protein
MDSLLEEAVLSELVSEAKFPGNWEKYRDFYRRDLRVRLLARNPEPKSVVYDPIPYASEQGSYFWPSRELNRIIRELIRLISEPRDLAVISISGARLAAGHRQLGSCRLTESTIG